MGLEVGGWGRRGSWGISGHKQRLGNEKQGRSGYWGGAKTRRRAGGAGGSWVGARGQGQGARSREELIKDLIKDQASK